MSENKSENDVIHLFIESPDGQRFECEVPAETELSTLAADFFEAQGWPTRDGRGRGQRAVVELIDPENPDRTKRLRGDQTAHDAGLWNGAILRVFPESIAGRVEEHDRIHALVVDHQEIIALVEWNTHITFQANLDHAPFKYEVTFDYPSFRALADDGHTPLISTEHRAEIFLGAEYPRRAPRVRWLTPIFHPNIHPDNGAVCLGVLMYRYLPGMGLARLVTMLAEMVQWRNFDPTDCYNLPAAEWAADPQHWQHIRKIGGSPFQGPVHEWVARLEELWQGQGKRRPITFQRVP